MRRPFTIDPGGGGDAAIVAERDGRRRPRLPVPGPDLAGRRVAILGSRGYPSTYGGFETLVRHLAPALRDLGADVTVYGRGHRPGRAMCDGIAVVDTPGWDRQSTSTLTFGATSAAHAVVRRFDAALVLNVANGYWLPALRAAGIPTVVNVDGLEWERGKWNAAARQVFRSGARLTAWYADRIVCDAQAMVDVWRDQFGVDGRYIPYGAEPRRAPGADRVLALGLEPGSYPLCVARLAPENNVAMFLDAVETLALPRAAVVVGSAPAPAPIEDRLRRLERDGRVRWLGHVADQELLGELWARSGVYWHGHSAGGTNPALLQALALGAPTIAYDSCFNREVLGSDGHFVRDAPTLAAAMAALLEDESLRAQRSAAGPAIVAGRYRWADVCRAYGEVLEDVIAAADRRRAEASRRTERSGFGGPVAVRTARGTEGAMHATEPAPAVEPRSSGLRGRLLTIMTEQSRRRGASSFDPGLSLGSAVALSLAIVGKLVRGLPYRLLFAEAHTVLVGRGASIRHPRHIRCKGSLVVEDYAEIQGLSTGGIEFGDRVTIGRFASIRPSGYYGRQIGAGLTVGDRSSIGPHCWVGCAGPIRIGARVMMGQSVHLLAERHNIDDPDRPMQDQGVTRTGIVIEDDCWIGSSSCILDGVTIGAGSVVAAGAVVTKSVPPGSVVAGVPARVVRGRQTAGRTVVRL